MAGDFTAPRLIDLRDLRLVKIGSDANGDYYGIPTTLVGSVTGIFVSGESHLGQVGGDSEPVTVNLTVAAAQHAIGDSLGGKLTIIDAMRVEGGEGVLHSITIIDKGNQKPTGHILIFSADPSTSTLTDDAAVSVAAADAVKVLGVIEIAASRWYTIASRAYQTISGLGIIVGASLITSKNLYAAWNLDNTVTPASTSDYTIHFGFLRD
jgi:hypothetical protein